MVRRKVRNQLQYTCLRTVVQRNSSFFFCGCYAVSHQVLLVCHHSPPLTLFLEAPSTVGLLKYSKKSFLFGLICAHIWISLIVTSFLFCLLLVHTAREHSTATFLATQNSTVEFSRDKTDHTGFSLVGVHSSKQMISLHFPSFLLPTSSLWLNKVVSTGSDYFLLLLCDWTRWWAQVVNTREGGHPRRYQCYALMGRWDDLISRALLPTCSWSVLLSLSCPCI